MLLPLEWLTAVSVVGCVATFHAIPRFRDAFLKANIHGVDVSKRRKPKIPEATGVISGCLFLIMTISMIPLAFRHHLLRSGGRKDEFPHEEFVQLLAALLSVSCMLLLGFADDVLDLRWRHKLLLPTMASLPLLVVYYVSSDRTQIVMPAALRWLVGGARSVDLGLLYYAFMGLLAVFCTNAINILAGINGLEVGQSVVIAASVAVFNLREMDGELGHDHRFSLYFLFPYLATSLPLLWYNWYPSKVFPGDTFCYFSGMTLAVVAILGHFSKTLLLFLVPQLVNFLYSTPQLFHLVPCPRHRMPRYDPDADALSMSLVAFDPTTDAKFGAMLWLRLLKALGLLHMKERDVDGRRVTEINNLTLLNLALKAFGPMHERNLTILLLLVQAACTCVAFAIRYPLAMLLFGEVVA